MSTPSNFNSKIAPQVYGFRCEREGFAGVRFFLRAFYFHVSVGLLVIVGLVKIWPQSVTWRQLSARRVIGYTLLLVVLTLLLGLIGLIASVLVIVLSEAKRGAFVRQPAV